MSAKFCLLLICLLWLPIILAAQMIKGNVIVYDDATPLMGVRITNIHSGTETIADSKGQFSIWAKSDELLEFHHEGYRVERVRIPKMIPSYFTIQMQRIVPKFVLQKGATGNYHNDSLRYGILYARPLSKPRFGTLDVINHPFSAMSKGNRRVWAFQDNYTWFEQMKYVDYAFSDKILQQLTGLGADSAARYRRRFALPYEQVRSMKTYDLFNYIKETVYYFRTGTDRRRSPVRISN